MLEKGKKHSEQENAVGPESGQLEQVIRYSLLTLTGLADRIKEIDPDREKNQVSLHQRPNNLLDPTYTRPWWSFFAGACGLYLGYRLFGERQSGQEK